MEYMGFKMFGKRRVDGMVLEGKILDCVMGARSILSQ